MVNIATSVDQSKRLLELGLKPDTADMYWDFQETGYILIADELGYYHNDSEIPAWSLSALMEMMPNDCGIDKEDDKFIASYVILHECGEYSSKTSPIDAAFEMIVYLINNEYIKI